MVEVEDLKKIILFRDFSEAEIQKIKPVIFERAYPKGTILFREGMPGGVMYMVKSGRIEIFTKKEEQEISITILKAGNFVGEMSLIDDEPRSASVRIVEDAMLMVLNKKCLQNIITANPEGGNKILMVLLRMLCQRLRETNSKLSLP